MQNMDASDPGALTSSGPASGGPSTLSEPVSGSPRSKNVKLVRKRLWAGASPTKSEKRVRTQLLDHMPNIVGDLGDSAIRDYEAMTFKFCIKPPLGLFTHGLEPNTVSALMSHSGSIV